MKVFVDLSVQSKKRELLRGEEEDGDSILSSDAGSIKRKRYEFHPKQHDLFPLHQMPVFL